MIFTVDEIKILQDHGKRLQLLAEGRQLPTNEASQSYVEVIKSTCKAGTAYERTWLKIPVAHCMGVDPANRAAMGPPRKAYDDTEGT